MSYLSPSEIAARREAVRRRSRRRRAVVVATLLALIAAACIAIAEAGAGSGHHALARHLPTTRARSHMRLRSRPSAAALERAEIERLIQIGLPIYCAGTRGDEVAFTFDDGPGVYTHYAVKKLTEAHEGATFFVVGKSIEAWTGWVQREVKFAALGDHTYTHPFLPSLSPNEIQAQLEQTKLKIEQQSGQPVYLFRPPYGARDATVDEIARSLGLLEILWTVDSADSLGADWAGIIRNVEAGLRPGAIFLMHENRGQTIRALTTLLPYLTRHHLRSVSVPELLASDPPTLAQLRAGANGCGQHPSLGRGA
jgi:peptidoglycan/xylan/chitin deacetylase (PgdA/CDA1 family)